MRYIRKSYEQGVFVFGFVITAGFSLGYFYDIFGISTLPYVLPAALGFARCTNAGWRPLPVHFDIVILFTCLLALGVFYTSVPSYGLNKVLRFGLFWALIPIGLFQLIRSEGEVFALFRGMMLGALASAPIIFSLTGGLVDAAASTETFTRLVINEANPITISRHLGQSVVLILAWTMLSRWSFARLLAVPPCGALVGFMVLTGSKGPLISLMIAIVILFVQRGRDILLAPMFVGLLVVGVASAAEIFLPEGFIEYRFQLAGSGSVSSRLDFIFLALSNFAASGPFHLFFGAGTGNYPSLLGEVTRSYPHNIFVEVLYENGLIGFVCLSAITSTALFYALRAYVRPVHPLTRQKRIVWATATSLYVFHLINALFTGDIASNIDIGVWGGMIMVLSRVRASNMMRNEKQMVISRAIYD